VEASGVGGGDDGMTTPRRSWDRDGMGVYVACDDTIGVDEDDFKDFLKK
jgi:hypothetical protein